MPKLTWTSAMGLLSVLIACFFWSLVGPVFYTETRLAPALYRAA